jgi:hypothetical protein
VNRLAQEATKTAGQVLTMCIRALDYCPPVDLTFGEYLRALITADMDLIPEDDNGYRVAFIEAFRRRGIYPRDVRTLSEDSLRWSRPGEDPGIEPGKMEEMIQNLINRDQLDQLRYLKSRRDIWFKTREMRQQLHGTIKDAVEKAELLQRLTGLALTDFEVPEGVRRNRHGKPFFSVDSLREARRQKQDGSMLNQVFVTILQKETLEHQGQMHTIRCGSTLVIDLDEARVIYVIRKGLHDMERLSRTIAFKESQDTASLAATYFGESREPFAALHRLGA